MNGFIRKLQWHIENTTWDEWLLENDRYLKKFCLTFTILAAIYFGIFTIIGLTG